MGIYKYVGPKRVDMISNEIVRFSQPSVFNDPFEALPSFRSFTTNGLSNEFIEKYFEPFEIGERGIVDGNRILTLQEIKKLRAKLAADEKSEEEKLMRDFVSSMKNDLLDRVYGILSLSRNPDSLLMWAHYAVDHTGLLIEFDEDHQFFSKKVEFNPVTYSSNRTREAFLTDDKVDLDSMLYRKSPEWAYEQEWRVVTPLARAQRKIKRNPLDIYLFKLPLRAVKAVTLGARTTPYLRRKLIDVLRKSRSARHIKLYKAELHQNSFALDYRHIPT